MIDLPAAARAVAASPLFDEQWYAATSGRVVASRAEAVEAWVTDPGEASPHPLFEPDWLYPAGAWRRHAPDPLSFYLTRPRRPARAPHPRYRPDDLGPLEDWLAAGHDPAEVLVAPLERAPVGEVLVDVLGDDLGLAVRWARHLARVSPDVVGVVRAATPGGRRVLDALVADLPTIRVVDTGGDTGWDTGTDTGGVTGTPAPVVVSVDAGLAPPRWPWLPPLVAALEGGAAAAQPVLLADDFTVASPLLVGHPVQDAERLDGLALPHPAPGVIARASGRDGRGGPTVLAAGSRLFGPAHADPGPEAEWLPLWTAAGFSAPGRALTVREGRPALRWAIDIPAGAGPIGTAWGDWHFARSLADALERQGQWVAIDHPETRGRGSRSLDDVVLTLRGLERLDPAPAPPPGGRPRPASLLWVIYNPHDVTREEAAAHDVVLAAGTTWAAERSAEWGLPVRPLLQCTDATRFHPGLGEPGGSGEGALFVGNARGGMRPSVESALEAGLDLTVIGLGWDAWLPAGGVAVEATRIANTDLPSRYARAAVVLNDHHHDMRVEGFVSNRVFDVLAVGGRLLSDDVAGLSAVLGVDLPVWRTAADLARLAAPPYDAFPDAAARRALADQVVAQHSFDARAATLLEAALEVRAARA